MSIDPRLVERRRHVAEERARRRVGRLIKLLLFGAVVGSVIWLLLSPLLSVRRVAVTGVSASSAYPVLAEQGVVAGAPMITIRPKTVEQALLEDPWIAAGEVETDWPDLVVVRIEERLPLAWVETEQGGRVVAVDGVVLLRTDQPGEDFPLLRFPEVGEEEITTSPVVLGSLLFVATLDAKTRNLVVLWQEGSGELWAEVAGYRVRLGRAVEMEDKARSLAALLADAPPPGATLNLIAPTNPAVVLPESQDVVEG